MHGPVAASLGVLTRPVERIDDPDPLGRQPPAVVDGLLRQHAVVGPCSRQPLGEQLLRAAVAEVLELAALDAGVISADGEQELPCGHRQLGCEGCVGESVGHGASSSCGRGQGVSRTVSNNCTNGGDAL